MKVYDVVALGELLIDFTEHGVSEQGNPLWEANPGGAPCNVLAMLNRLDRRTAFIGKVGRDVYGDQLRQVVTDAGPTPPAAPALIYAEPYMNADHTLGWDPTDPDRENPYREVYPEWFTN